MLGSEIVKKLKLKSNELTHTGMDKLELQRRRLEEASS
jgi:hypothetical protein